MAEWITPADVAEWLGSVAPDDPRLVRSTAAAKAAVERRRGDLAFADAATTPEDVITGGIMWAGTIYQQRSAPSGYDGYDAETALADAGPRRAEIFKLLGIDRGGRPVVA